MTVDTEQVKVHLRDVIERNLGASAIPLVTLPSDVVGWLDDLLSKVDTYRDGALTLLAYPVAAGRRMDVTVRPIGARGVSGFLDREVLTPNSIACRREALQTIGKNSPALVRGNREAWDRLLGWASQRALRSEIEDAFEYLGAGIARTSRKLPPMPDLDVTRLTFPRLSTFFEALLSRRSNGTYEQFVFASLMHAWVMQERPGERVDTKPLNASDASAGTVADVQHIDRGHVLDAYEVTANQWPTKVQQAMAAMKASDLQRIHILAERPPGTLQGLDPDVDISVLDLRSEIDSLVARLSRPYRKEALKHLYSLLAEKQSDDALVIHYVGLLGNSGLSVGP